MAIYRGPGGSGDAVNDSSSETRLAVEARDAAIAAQAAAEAAQAAAETAEANAELAETNAETAETNAETAEANAETAQAAAEAAQAAAETAQAAAELAETNAETAETNAETAATNAASSASSASTSASNAATSATNASNSATAAATSATNASNSATAAASSASSASTSATNAANSATAAQTAETNAETAETNAETAQAAAELAETNAETAATNAASSASAAATSASNAASSASAASTSASNAASSASAASSSATSAASSASSSQAAADAALAALDSFDDRYLGQKSSAPTVDNDGNALVTGALYFDTVSNAMKVWDGSAWLSAYASLSGALLATNNLSDLNSVSTARTNLGVTATGSDTTYAYRANNLSDLASASTARTNLGLGTAATTAATDYATAAQGAKADTAHGWGNHASAGYLTTSVAASTYQPLDSDLTAFAAKTAPTGDVVGTSDTQTLTNKTLTSPTISSPSISSGNLSFSTTGQRITGDMSNATLANRVAFQTSTTNGNSTPILLPNGTSTVSGLLSFNNSDPTNASFGAVLAVGNIVQISSGITGTGTYLPLTMLTGGSERMRVDTSGNVGIGTSSPSAKLDVRTAAGTAAQQNLYTGSSGAAATLQFGQIGAIAWDVGITSTSGHFQIGVNGGGLGYNINRSGTAIDYHSWSTAGSERMRIDSSGNVGIGTSSPSNKLQINGTAGVVRTGADAYFYIQETSSQSYSQALILADSTTSWYVANRYAGSGAGVSGFGIGTTNSADMLQIDTSANLYFNSGYGSAAVAYGCRAWVNFNGTGTVAIRASGNVSSITDNGTGDYTVNFTNAMPDANYSAVGTAGRNGTGGSNLICDAQYYAGSTSAQRFLTYNYSGGGLIDAPAVSFVVHR